MDPQLCRDDKPTIQQLAVDILSVPPVWTIEWVTRMILLKGKGHYNPTEVSDIVAAEFMKTHRPR
jgi:hypothetical protein